ncbi:MULTISPECIES: hypothetical protein [unclassified Streptomyces]|uniref:hypothetical protein n=1 Tax=unclassified Streptomyces TaxID=2593676 RepID=UPI000879E3F6|nr:MULTISPECIES: hypothetical protein [unclassified Streptomyces]REH18375.1 hypothetical protein BX268_0059 [Streptomyces sp. 2221.1]SDS21480.1 hypothetical protein SAMN05428941_0063 [Streptomyces sp. 2114.2]
MTTTNRYTALLPLTPHTAALAQDFLSSVLSVWKIDGAESDCHKTLSALFDQADPVTHSTVQVSIERLPEGIVRIEITPGVTQMSSGALGNRGSLPF